MCILKCFQSLQLYEATASGLVKSSARYTQRNERMTNGILTLAHFIGEVETRFC